MRTPELVCLAVLALAAGCGQKGPLVLPKKSVATPVVIRAPADATGAATPAAEPAPEPKKKDESGSPPGG